MSSGMSYQKEGLLFPYQEWPKKAVKWIKDRKLFDPDIQQMYDSHRNDYGVKVYDYYGSNPRKPKMIKRYPNRLTFDWSKYKLGPFRNSNNLRWITFYNDGNIMIEWLVETNGIQLVTEDEIYYRLDNKEVHEAVYAKYHLMIHLEEFQPPKKTDLINKWLYEEPLIGDENL